MPFVVTGRGSQRLRIAGVKISAGTPRPIEIAAAMSSVRNRRTFALGRRSLLCRETCGQRGVPRVICVEIHDRNAHTVLHFAFAEIMQVRLPPGIMLRSSATCFESRM